MTLTPEQDRARYHNNPERRAACKQSARAFLLAHPERQKAYTKVRGALKSGRLTRQPYEVCGARKVEAHHDDYSQPLKVRWFCKRHHEKHHSHRETL